MSLYHSLKQAYWQMPGVYRSIRQKSHHAYLRTNRGYRAWLRNANHVTGPCGKPEARWHNATLKTPHEWKQATDQVKRLGLPLHEDLPKNWDSLAALDLILGCTTTNARVLDAGSALYSVILPWLFLYGYKRLIGINLLFKSRLKRGPITYEFGDITRTDFGPGTFYAITCLSVVEHGVDLDLYFREMARILKPNGVLFTSTDYYEFPIHTAGKVAFGVPIHIFTREEVVDALQLARRYSLEPTTPPDLSCIDKPIYWKEFDLRYTFLNLTLRKRA